MEGGGLMEPSVVEGVTGGVEGVTGGGLMQPSVVPPRRESKLLTF